MSGLQDWLLSALLAYGMPLYGTTILLSAFGVPLPVSLLVIAAGAFVSQGLLDWRLVLLVGWGAALLGDSGAYWVGRLAENWVERRFGKIATWQAALNAFARRGWLAVFLSRFWLTPLALPVNLISGSRYRYMRFLTADASGELIWVAGYAGLGYFFGGQWETVSTFISDFSGLSVGLVVLTAGMVAGMRYWKKNATARRAAARPPGAL